MIKAPRQSAYGWKYYLTDLQSLIRRIGTESAVVLDSKGQILCFSDSPLHLACVGALSVS